MGGVEDSRGKGAQKSLRNKVDEVGVSSWRGCREL